MIRIELRQELIHSNQESYFFICVCFLFVAHHSRIRKALENNPNMEDDDVAFIENLFAKHKLIAEEISASI